MAKNGEYAVDWHDVEKRNTDLGERLTKEGLAVRYDEDGDTLFATIGEGGDALTEQVFEDVYVRLHPKTLKIQGFVILAFEADFLGENKLIRKSLMEFFDTLRGSGDSIEFKGREACRAKPYFEAAIANR